MRTIGFVTTSRADYGILRAVIDAVGREPELEAKLLVSGTHLLESHGATLAAIERDGHVPAATIPVPMDGEHGSGAVEAMSVALRGFGAALDRLRPDLVVVVGDRFEMHAAALAALPLLLPVAHLHGGEVTEGAFDDALRHSLTKLSHLHFVATATSRRRLLQMGEEPWRVVISGAPALDTLLAVVPVPPDELADELGYDRGAAPVLVTFHPATLEPGSAEDQATELLEALRGIGRPIVFTGTNVDPGGGAIRRRIDAFVRDEPGTVLVESLGHDRYAGLLASAGVMVGNSSSGIIEAPSFGLPVVNVGDRQAGRERGGNVTDVPAERTAIRAAVDGALRPGRRDELAALANPYGSGRSAAVIVERLRDVALGPELLRKRFVDLAVDEPG